jgi:NADPH:quinone reductase-like Zn-dependent oxidoreductase
MKAMVLEAPGRPLLMQSLPDPQPAAGEIVVRVEACGVCRTDLHVVDGELPHPRLPVVPGHEIVGIVTLVGAGVTGSPAGASAFPGSATPAAAAAIAAEARRTCVTGRFSPATRGTVALRRMWWQMPAMHSASKATAIRWLQRR